VKHMTKALIVSLILVSGVAVAKTGVQDPTVKARQDLMGTVAMNTKVLGDMAGGKAPFDAIAAEGARTALAAAAAEIPTRFKPQATDPVSEAKPEIWISWADFVTKANGLAQAAAAIDTTSVDGVKAGMGGVGAACKACHSVYRM